LDSIKYVFYEKDKHKADVNIFQHFQVLKRKFCTKTGQRMKGFPVLDIQTHKSEGVTCERWRPVRQHV